MNGKMEGEVRGTMFSGRACLKYGKVTNLAPFKIWTSRRWGYDGNLASRQYLPRAISGEERVVGAHGV